ncbi:GNAT family N-acetyltransferase [Streptomyces sp. NPDC051907]|uniref:GNAT family N-acetyltransferase n=1 Tax=Streptomyces sp. NPDC051907 TaxID=3155284 RepID=UPI00342F80DA
MTESRQHLVIRRLVTADLAAVLEIYNHAVRWSTATLDTQEKTPAQMRHWLDGHDERYPAVAAEADGKVVGYGSLSQFAARGGYRASAEISVYVDPRSQGVGVGTALSRWLTRHAEEAGLTGVLAVITSDNTRSRRLFGNAGYTYTGVLSDIGYKRGTLVDLALYQRSFPANRARYAGLAAGDAGAAGGADNGLARAVHAQADAVTELLKHDEAPALDASRPIVLAGAGLSLHSCRTAAAWARLLSGGRIRPAVLPAHSLHADSLHADSLHAGEPLHADDQLVLVSPGDAGELPGRLLDSAAYVVEGGQGGRGGRSGGGPGGSSHPGQGARAVTRAAELTVLAQLIAATLGQDTADELTSGLSAVPDALRRTLDLPLSPLAGQALTQGRPAPVAVVGGGLDAHSAAEAAAALHRRAHRWAEGVCLDAALDSALHGGAGDILGSAAAVCLIRPPEPARRQADRLAGRLRSLGVRVVISSDDEESDMPFPHVPYLARPFVATAPFWRLAAEGTATR